MLIAYLQLETEIRFCVKEVNCMPSGRLPRISAKLRIFAQIKSTDHSIDVSD